MNNIIVEKLSSQEAIELTKSNDFNKFFASLTSDDKKTFLSKIKNNNKKENHIQESITEQKKVKPTPPKPKNNPPKPKAPKTKVTVKRNQKVEATITEQAKSLTKGVVDWAKSGFKNSSTEEYAHRMSICRKCEFWKEIPGPIIGRCMKCGCTGAKQKLATSRCPIGKW